MIPGYETVDHDKIERMLAARLESLGIPAEALDAPVSDSSTPPIPGGSYAASGSFCDLIADILTEERMLRSAICITASVLGASQLRNKG